MTGEKDAAPSVPPVSMENRPYFVDFFSKGAEKGVLKENRESCRFKFNDMDKLIDFDASKFFRPFREVRQRTEHVGRLDEAVQAGYASIGLQ